MGSYTQQREQYLGKVLSLHKSGMNAASISRILPVPRETLTRWIRKFADKSIPNVESQKPLRNNSSLREKYYDEVIRLHFEEGYGEGRIEQVLPIGHTTASRWIANFVAENGNQNQSVMKEKQLPEGHQASIDTTDVKQLRAEINRLQGQLRKEKLRADAYDLMIDLAEQKFKVPIRKKSGAKQ